MADAGMYRRLAHAERHEASFGALDYLGPACSFAMHMIQTPAVGGRAVACGG